MLDSCTSRTCKVKNRQLRAISYKLIRCQTPGVVNRLSLDDKRVPVRKNPLRVQGTPESYDLHNLVSWLLELEGEGRTFH